MSWCFSNICIVKEQYILITLKIFYKFRLSLGYKHRSNIAPRGNGSEAYWKIIENPISERLNLSEQSKHSPNHSVITTASKYFSGHQLSCHR